MSRPMLAHGVFEKQAVFGFLDGFDLRADQFDAVFFEHAGFGEIHREIQPGLAAHGGEQRVGAFSADHFFGEGDAEGLDVGAVGQIRDRS